jgi:UDP-galactopyranose mutase
MKKVLIIGGGFAGCTSAHQINLLKKQYDITLIEKGSVLGAGVRTSWYGGHPYTFGPRHFLTPHQHVFEFLNKYLPLRKCPEHEAWTYVEKDGEFYNFPIHRDDIERMPDKEIINKEIECAKGVENSKNLEEYWINSVGRTLYEKFVLEYNKKMWRIPDNKLHDTFSWSAKGFYSVSSVSSVGAFGEKLDMIVSNTPFVGSSLVGSSLVGPAIAGAGSEDTPVFLYKSANNSETSSSSPFS